MNPVTRIPSDRAIRRKAKRSDPTLSERSNPRPVQTKLPIWVGVGGTPSSRHAPAGCPGVPHGGLIVGSPQEVIDKLPRDDPEVTQRGQPVPTDDSSFSIGQTTQKWRRLPFSLSSRDCLDADPMLACGPVTCERGSSG